MITGEIRYSNASFTKNEEFVTSENPDLNMIMDNNHLARLNNCGLEVISEASDKDLCSDDEIKVSGI